MGLLAHISTVYHGIPQYIIERWMNFPHDFFPDVNRVEYGIIIYFSEYDSFQNLSQDFCDEKHRKLLFLMILFSRW